MSPTFIEKPFYNMSTEREKKLEQKVLELEAELAEPSRKLSSLALDNLSACVSYVDSDQRYRFVNKSYEDWFGHSIEEIRGKHLREVLGEDAYNLALSKILEVLNGKRVSFEAELPYKDAGTRYVYVEYLPDIREGETLGFFSYINNITEQKEAENALRESEKRYRALFEGCAEGIIIANIETLKFDYANPAICEMLGYSVTELKDFSVMDIHPKEDLEFVISEFQAQARGEKVLSSRIPCLKKDGTVFYADINTTRISIGGIDYNVGFFTDITERMKAEEELKQSEGFGRQSLEVLDALVSIHDLKNHRIIHANDLFKEVFGEGCVGKHCYEVIHPAFELELNPSACIFGGEFGAKRKKEIQYKEKYYEITILPIEDELVHVARDVTERKKAQDALQESEERFQRAIAAVNTVGIWDWDIKTNEVIWRGVERLFRLEEGTFGGSYQTFIDLVVDADKERVQNTVATAVESGEDYFCEYSVLWPDGTIHHQLARGKVEYDDKGKPLKMAGTVEDITERKEAEKELRNSREKLKSLVESSEDHIYQVDRDGRFIFANPTYLSRLGEPLEKIVSHNYGEFCPVEQEKIFLTYVKKVFESGEHSDLEHQSARDEKYFIKTFCPIKDDDGNVESVMIIAKDITEIKEAEEEKQKLTDQLIQSEKIASLGMLVGGIAHEINNPLTSICGYAELIKNGESVPEDVKRYSQIIQELTMRCASIIKSLLQLAHKAEGETSSVDLNDLVQETYTLLKPGFSADNVAFQTDLADDLKKICAESTLIEQVLINIATNAYQAIVETGKPGHIRIKTRDKGDRAYVCIENTGPEMKEPEKIFDPFYTTKAPDKGTGLGLSLVHKIITDHNGTIRASNYENGARFEMTFPTIDDPTESIDRTVETTLDGKGKRLLIIDDEESIRMILQRNLEKCGYEVETASDGAQGIEMLSKNDYDMVLSDVKMPKKTGKDVYEYIKANRPGLETRTILISGDIVSSLKKTGLGEIVGESRYLAKPFVFEELKNKIADLENES